MQLSRLITYRFQPNVGPLDRVFRCLSGAFLVALPWLGLVDLPGWTTVLLTGIGLAWMATGILGRCGLYYVLGLSTKRSD